MCNQIINQIFSDKTGSITPPQKLILIAMARFCKPDDARAYRSINDLAADTQLSRRCIMTNLNSLKKASILIPIEGRHGFQTLSVVYMINLNRINNGERFYRASNALADASNAPSMEKKTDSGRAPDALQILDIDINNNIYNKKISNEEKQPEPTQDVYSEDNLKKKFEEWWEIYPRKENKRKAYEAFCKEIKMTDFETLLYKAKSYARMRDKIVSKKADQVIFTLTPKNWLKQGRWEENYGANEIKPSDCIQQIEDDPNETEEIQLIRNKIKGGLGSGVYNSWFKGQKIEIQGREMIIKADTKFKSNWITTHFLRDILRIFKAQFESVTVTTTDQIPTKIAA